MTTEKQSRPVSTGLSRHPMWWEIYILDLCYIFTFYYICAVVRATDTTCVLQEVYEGHIGNTSNIKYRDLCRVLIY